MPLSIIEIPLILVLLALSPFILLRPRAQLTKYVVITVLTISLIYSGLSSLIIWTLVYLTYIHIVILTNVDKGLLLVVFLFLIIIAGIFFIGKFPVFADKFSELSYVVLIVVALKGFLDD